MNRIITLFVCILTITPSFSSDSDPPEMALWLTYTKNPYTVSLAGMDMSDDPFYMPLSDFNLQDSPIEPCAKRLKNVDEQVVKLIPEAGKHNEGFPFFELPKDLRLRILFLFVYNHTVQNEQTIDTFYNKQQTRRADIILKSVSQQMRMDLEDLSKNSYYEMCFLNLLDLEAVSTDITRDKELYEELDCATVSHYFDLLLLRQ